MNPIPNAPVHPVARTESLVVTEVGGDTLVYDLLTHRAHSLDAEAARVWRLCDGTRDVAALAAALGATSGATSGGTAEAVTREDVVRFALRQLEEVGLARDVPPPAQAATRLSRRELLGRLAQAGVATLAIPTVLSVVAPTTLYALSSCANRPCYYDSDCCPGSRCVGAGPTPGARLGHCK